MKKPLASVILPTFNREATIEKAILSVLNQTHDQLELIVVDDGSRDGTESIVNGIKDPRLTFIKAPSNQGAGAARNIGLSHAQGDYILFQDSDDEWMAEKIETHLKAHARHEDKEVVTYCAFYKWNGKTREYGPRTGAKNGKVLEHTLTKNIAPTLSLCVPKSCMAEVGPFDETLKYSIDHDFVIRLAQKFEFSFIDQPLYIYNATDSHQRISTQKKFSSHGYKTMLAKHGALFSKYPQALADYHYKIGKTDFLNGQAGYRKHLTAAVQTRFKFKYLLFLCATFLGREKVNTLMAHRAALGRNR